MSVLANVMGAVRSVLGHPRALAAAAGLSLVAFVGTLVLIPLIVIRMRPDYFVRRRRPPIAWRRQHPLLAALGAGTKNAAGVGLVLVGLVMLAIPGQGILTVLIGLTLMNYPGKYRAERWLATRRSVWRVLNWLRARAHAPPLEWPRDARGDGDA